MTPAIYNFCPGPATMPPEVLEQVQAELLDYRGCGVSVLEISHRSRLFDRIAESAQERVRRILSVPAGYSVLFLAGGATCQFAQLPLNLATAGRQGYYLVHGHWGRKALAEAGALGLGRLAASSEDSGFDHIPALDAGELPDEAAYLHIVSNETITGVQFDTWPDATVPLAADMSSDIFSRQLDVGRFGVIYAGAQKNFGPAGMSLVIVKDSLLEGGNREIPGIWSWRVQREFDSRYNTPPTFAWYMAELVLAWLERQGGLPAMERVNGLKARLLYQCIDNSALYSNRVDPGTRSVMNIPFVLEEESLNTRFLRHAETNGLLGLKGHKSVGGMRASIYNAMPVEGVRALVDFMQEFERSLA